MEQAVIVFPGFREHQKVVTSFRCLRQSNVSLQEASCERVRAYLLAVQLQIQTAASERRNDPHISPPFSDIFILPLLLSAGIDEFFKHELFLVPEEFCTLRMWVY